MVESIWNFISDGAGVGNGWSIRGAGCATTCKATKKPSGARGPKVEGKSMADRVGFEPTVTFQPHTLSKRAHSTTLTPVHILLVIRSVLARGGKLAGGLAGGKPFLMKNGVLT